MLQPLCILCILSRLVVLSSTIRTSSVSVGSLMLEYQLLVMLGSKGWPMGRLQPLAVHMITHNANWRPCLSRS